MIETAMPRELVAAEGGNTAIATASTLPIGEERDEALDLIEP
ncbi:hypothetical protein GGD63_007214 [Bradyrhizobium sp. cir1]|nr:hypothetical protein [Bradyrhizobium sp. cir1]MBB4374384.1 hypothetical protein [Bradyrhizobium sp. cir1]